MSNNKPLIDLDMILDWIRCPLKVFRKRKNNVRVFDYESLFRFMLLNTLKAGYRDADSSDKLNLEQHVPDIWEYLLKNRSVPNPKLLIRNMYEFSSMRCRYTERIEKRYADSTNMLNITHWWDLGLVFDADYYCLRDKINKYQSFLGFPPWNIVKTYYREYEYIPVSLADTFSDYLSGIRVFSRRKIPSNNIRFDVPAYLELEDIRLAVHFDILWRREKIYKSKTQRLNPGLIAEQLIPCSLYTNADQILRERMILGDIRMPLTGVDYTDGNGNLIRIDSVTCCTFPSKPGTTAWKESRLTYDNETKAAILSVLNHYGLACLEASEKNLFIPCNLVKNEACSACSFLKECMDNKMNLSALPEITPRTKRVKDKGDTNAPS